MNFKRVQNFEILKIFALIYLIGIHLLSSELQVFYIGHGWKKMISIIK